MQRLCLDQMMIVLRPGNYRCVTISAAARGVLQPQICLCYHRFLLNAMLEERPLHIHFVRDNYSTRTVI